MESASTSDKLAIDGGERLIDSPLPTIQNSSGRLIGEEEKREVMEVLDTGNLAYIYGHKVKEFENKFAELLGANHAVAVSSGTAALHTALIYLNPEPGDEILVSPITDMGSVIPILYQQAIPVFVDVDPLNQNMDPSLIEQHISSKTKAILVTHIYGSPADMNEILKIAQKHNLCVIEDCAQAHLTEHNGQFVGTIGDVGCFSFQQSKHITTGDGGMVVYNEDKRFGREMRMCFDKGWPRHLPGRDHYFLAPNYHMTELQAAIGIAQIGKYEQCIASRRNSARVLTERLADERVIEPVGILPDCKHTYFYYALTLELHKIRVDAEKVVSALIAEGLNCELGYPGPIPLYMYPLINDNQTFGNSGWPFNSPVARRKWNYELGLCPIAEDLCKRTLILPWNEGLTSQHVELIAKAIRKVIRAYEIC